MLEPSHIQTLAHHFDLGEVTAWQQTGKVYRLHAQRGTFALRFYNTGVTLAHVAATQTVRLTLVEAGLPVGAPIRTAAGTTVVEWTGHLCELQPWMPHDGYGDSWSSIMAAAAPVRRIHDIMISCPVTPDQRDDPWRSPAELADHLEADAPYLRRLARQFGMDIDHELRLARQVLEALREGAYSTRARGNSRTATSKAATYSSTGAPSLV